MKAEEIRRRHGDLLQKIKSLKMAVNDRKMQLKEMITMGKKHRPKTGFLRTPNHIVILKGMLGTEVTSIRQGFSEKCNTRVYTVNETQTCDSLILDLEKQLRAIDLDLENSVEEYRKKEKEAEQLAALKDEPVKAQIRVPSITSTTGTLQLPTVEHTKWTDSHTMETVIHSGSDNISNSDTTSISVISTSCTPRSTEGKSVKKALPPLNCNTRPQPRPHDLNSLSSENEYTSPRVKHTTSTSADVIFQLQRAKVVSMAARKQSTNSETNVAVHRQSACRPSRVNNARSQYIIKPGVGYPFGSSFPDLPPIPQRKWNGKRYVTVLSAPTMEVSPSKASQVINIRQNTWLW